jgi:acyl-CoA dehydrogenase
LADASTAELREALRGWLADHAEELRPFAALTAGSLADVFEHERGFQRILYHDGWTRWGWPHEVGGLGGSLALRAVVYEEVYRAGYVLPEAYQVSEVLAPVLVKYAPDWAAECLPKFLNGDEHWCQGFTEPDAGSDLASLRTRAVEEDEHFRVSGQKVYTSDAHLARWCSLLVRTGAPGSAHRGLSMLWVDLKLPGVTVRPLIAASGRDEFSEVFFEDVLVPKSCLIGPLNGGWSVAMYMLQFERGTYAWLRQALLHFHLERACKEAAATPALAPIVGDAYLALYALRARARETVTRLAAGESLGPETSVDKLLLSTAEQAVFDAVRHLDWPLLETGDSNNASAMRVAWFYTRAASIFGGAAEVQRDIIAERLLGLPRSR